MNLTPEDLKLELMTISVVHVSIFGVTFIKKINILERLLEADKKNTIVRKYHSSKSTRRGNIADFKHKNNWLLDSNFNRMIDNIELKYQINNKLDVCIRLRNKETFGETAEEALSKDLLTVYIYEDALKDVQLTKNNTNKFITLKLLEMFETKRSGHKCLCQNYVWITTTKQSEDFTMNNSYMFMRKTKSI